MIKRLLSCIVIIIFSSCTAQILDVYPKSQDFYEGGLINFYKESHEYLVKNNIKKCDDQEIYQPRFIVTKDAVVKLITPIRQILGRMNVLTIFLWNYLKI